MVSLDRRRINSTITFIQHDINEYTNCQSFRDNVSTDNSSRALRHNEFFKITDKNMKFAVGPIFKVTEHIHFQKLVMLAQYDLTQIVRMASIAIEYDSRFNEKPTQIKIKHVFLS